MAQIFIPKGFAVKFRAALLLDSTPEQPHFIAKQRLQKKQLQKDCAWISVSIGCGDDNSLTSLNRNNKTAALRCKCRDNWHVTKSREH